MPSELDALFDEFRKRTPPRRESLHKRPLYVYGAGTTGRAVHRVLTDAGFTVDAFLDASAKPGATWNGVPILHPDDGAVTTSQRASSLVLVCVFNPFSEVTGILDSLRQRGFRTWLNFPDLHNHFARELGDNFWLTARSFYVDVQGECAAVYQLLSDQKSRELFMAILRYRLLGDLQALPAPDLRDQYFPMDLPAYEQPLRFVDCGAYQGDCIEQLIARGLKLDAIAAFEPDDANFVRLCSYVTSHRKVLPKDVYLFPCGVDSTARKLRFSGGQGTSSRIDSSGDTLIQCAAIDETLPSFAPSLIKLDIEGAELAALWGARRAITEYRPALAVSLYHKAPHLWQIPLLVADWYGDRARYYVRSHAHNGFELVLYVRP